MPATEDAYDPLRVLTDAAAKRSARVSQVQTAREVHWEWEQAWGFPTASTEALLAVGKLLRQNEDAFWLDYIGCELGCRKRVIDRGLLASDVDVQRFAAEVLAHGILVLAAAGDLAVLGRQLEVLALAEQMESVVDAVRSIHDRLHHWIFGHAEPPSPWITAAELSRACGGRMSGFSTANISKGINGQLTFEGMLGPNGKYRLFRHATQHRQMLSRIVANLKKATFVRFIFSDPNPGKTTPSG